MHISNELTLKQNVNARLYIKTAFCNIIFAENNR